MSFGSQDAWLSGRIENATEATRSTYSGKRRGPKGLSESLTCCRYTRLIRPCIPSSDAASLGKVHHWRPCPPAVEIISNVVAGYSATPRTHTPLHEGRTFSFASGRSRAQLPNVYQNIHSGGENAKLHDAAPKTGTKDLQVE